jgi:hypothetical protein
MKARIVTAHKSASMATVGDSRENKSCLRKTKNRLSSDWPSHGRRLHSLTGQSTCLFNRFAPLFSEVTIGRLTN